MNIIDGSFWFFSVSALISTVGVLLTRNVFKAALFLLGCLLSVAAIFILLSAEMLGVAQILLYGGGVIILILFGVMLTSSAARRIENRNPIGSTILAGAFLYVLTSTYASFPEKTKDQSFLIDSIHATGLNIMSTFLLPFELSAILLLVALVGAVVMSSTSNVKR